MPELLADHCRRPCAVMYVVQQNYIHSTVVG